jgi:hypothetical protein
LNGLRHRVFASSAPYQQNIPYRFRAGIIIDGLNSVLFLPLHLLIAAQGKGLMPRACAPRRRPAAIVEREGRWRSVSNEIVEHQVSVGRALGLRFASSEEKVAENPHSPIREMFRPYPKSSRETK